MRLSKTYGIGFDYEPFQLPPRGGDACCAMGSRRHFTVLTTDVERTVAVYKDLLTFTAGPRPAFPFPGAWLYNGDMAALDVIDSSTIPGGTGGVLDHIVCWREDLPSFFIKLRTRGLSFDLRRLPEGGHAAGVWPFYDPNGHVLKLISPGPRAEAMTRR